MAWHSRGLESPERSIRLFFEHLADNASLIRSQTGDLHALIRSLASRDLREGAVWYLDGWKLSHVEGRLASAISQDAKAFTV
jgi:hypothetical protein